MVNQVIEFSYDSNAEVARMKKSGLLFYEGLHRDRKGKVHEFSAKRVQNIANNTNRNLSKGIRLPWQSDHSKRSEDNLGDLEGTVYTEIITKENVPTLKDETLLGRLGVFTRDLVGKGKDVVERLMSGNISTLSASVDPATESFVEISATPWPALAQCTTFSKYGSDDSEDLTYEFSELTPVQPGGMDKEEKAKQNPMSMEEALGIEKKATKKEEDYQKLSQALSKVLINLYTSSEEYLKGKNPVEESYKALEYFNKEVEVLFDLTEEENTEKSPKLPTSVKDDNYVKRRANFASYSSTSPNLTFGGFSRY